MRDAPHGLRDLGWDDRWEAAFAEHAAGGFAAGRVCLEQRGAWHVLTAAGELPASLAGRLRHEATGRPDLPVVGDWVVLTVAPDEASARIELVLPRRSAFARRLAGATAEAQVLAANLDVVFLVSGLDGDYNPRRIERAVTLAWESGARPVVVLNKADLCDDVEARLAEVASVAPGVPVHATRGLDGGGLEAFTRELSRGVAGALLGSSGVGKSTIINRLLGRDELATAAVREHDSRGRHTTTHRELFVLPGGGLLVDTPGLREFGLWGEGSGIAATFADVDALAPECRYRDCRHADEPGCAVRQAVDDGRLDPERLASFHKLAKELAFLHRQVDARAALEEKRRWKSIHKMAKKFKPRG
jgi:ribosome biogenesis GTPase